MIAVTRKFSYKCIRLTLKALFVTLFRLKVINGTCIPQQGGVVICSNHPTYLDPLLIAAASSRNVCFIGHLALFSMRLIRAFLWIAECIPIKQRHPDRRALREAIRQLQRGEVLAIFPEGHREVHGRLKDGLPGAALIAMMSKTPIVPCALIGAYSAWPNEVSYPKPSPITVAFGHPFYIDSNQTGSREVILKRETNRIMTEIQELMTKFG